MAKRTFLQLCESYTPERHHDLNGWFLSEKIDGMRAFWDGGISRGLYANQVPWANVEKGGGDRVATGLWSRTGKVLFAPDWWLDEMPNFPLDGELHMGRNQFQKLMSIVKSFEGTDWTPVKYEVFDSPPYEIVFQDGEIETRIGNQRYSRYLSKVMDWVTERSKKKFRSVNGDVRFEAVHKWLEKNLDSKIAVLLPQERLPFATAKTLARIEEKLQEVVNVGGEGVIVRSHYAPWRPERSKFCLKIKPLHDAEGIVIGYTFGRKTIYGSKLLGKMGALILLYEGRRLELSGFSDEERILTINDGSSAEEYAAAHAGQEAPSFIINPKFPIGSVITFQYRELSDDKIPKEARYLRKA